jgi:signal transduction histidine kinase
MGAMMRQPAGLVVAGEEAAPATTARLWLARELHDSIASAIVIIGIQAGVADQALDHGEPGRERAREALRTIRAVSRQALQDLQATVATLRGSSSANGPPRGVDQLDALTGQAAGAGVRVGVTVQGPVRPLPPAVDLAAYRIVQEALTNVLRHAGPATAMVRLTYDDDHLSVQVDDDGHGTAAGWPPVGGNGLLGMRERIAALGGRLDAGPRPAGGFRVLATLPWTARHEVDTH